MRTSPHFAPATIINSFTNDEIAESFRNTVGVENTLNFYYKKYKNSSTLKNSRVEGFGISEFFKAGLDPIERYVGSYNIDIYFRPYKNSTEGYLEVSITNKTSLTLTAYHALPSYDDGGPMSNASQNYRFNVNIDYSKLKKLNNENILSIIILITTSGFSSSCGFVRNDQIVGKYHILDIDTYNGPCLAYELEDKYQICIVPSKILACSKNEQYIFIKQVPSGIKDTVEINYFIVPILKDNPSISPEKNTIEPIIEQQFYEKISKINLKKVIFNKID